MDEVLTKQIDEEIAGLEAWDLKTRRTGELFAAVVDIPERLKDAGIEMPPRLASWLWHVRQELLSR